MINNKGQFGDIFGIFRFVIIAFAVLVICGGLIYATGLLNDAFLDIGAKNEANAGKQGYVNLTDASVRTFGQMNNSVQGLRLVAIMLIFAEIMLIFILNSFKRVHPAMFMVWVFIVFLAVWLAAPIANSYEALLQGNVFGGLLHTFTGGNWLVLNLPLVTLLVGILGGIFMFINILRSGGEQQL